MDINPPDNLSILERLIRIETKLEIMITDRLDHENRIRTLEKARWPLPSVAVIISMVAAGIALWNVVNGG